MLILGCRRRYGASGAQNLGFSSVEALSGNAKTSGSFGADLGVELRPVSHLMYLPNTKARWARRQKHLGRKSPKISILTDLGDSG